MNHDRNGGHFDPDAVRAIADIVRGGNEVPTLPDDEWRDVAEQLVKLNGTGDRKATLARMIDKYPRLEALSRAVFDISPDAPTEQASLKTFSLLTASEMADRRPPEWLIEDVLVQQTNVMTSGDKASLKSFVVLDQAFCIAAGINWQGHRTKKGIVVYILGEGSGGIGPRLRALEQHYGISAPANLYFIPERVVLGTDAQQGEPPDLGRLIATFDTLPEPPVLVILDTLARMVIGDENSSKDMGRLVAASDTIRDRFKCTVGWVHHTNRMGTTRGSTALGGAMDTMILAKRSGMVVTLECEKQKDFAEFRPIALQAEIIEVGETAEGKPITSLALTRIDGPTGSGGAARLLAVLVDNFGREGATDTQWKEVADSQNVPRSSYYRLKRELLEQERSVVKFKQRFYPADMAPGAGGSDEG